MPRKVRIKYHYLYRTTNLITKEFYIGVHSTYNLEDGYLGSGTKLWRRIQKYGRENFEKEILEFFENAELKFLKEKEIVNEQFLQDPLCMNLQLGGGGGFCNDEHKKKWIKVGSDAGNKKQQELWENDKEWALKESNRRKKQWENKEYREKALVGFSFKDKTHDNDTKKKIGKANSIKQLGNSNSQYGTIWINNGIEIKKIKKEELVNYKDWKLGRKIK